MADIQDQQTEIMPDIDAVRHLNQFCSLDNPIMEVACTSERADLVRRFFQESEIQLWPQDINPLRDPPTDESLAATRRHLGHTIRIHTAWWKTAH